LDAAGRGRSLSFSSSGLCSSHIFLTMRWSVPVYHLHLAVCPPWSHAEWCLMDSWASWMRFWQSVSHKFDGKSSLLWLQKLLNKSAQPAF
jgi:hypothetical protein